MDVNSQSEQGVVPLGRLAPLCRLEDIADGEARGIGVNVGEQWDLILLRRGDAVYAYHNECPHAGRNLDYAPGQFLVRNGVITCAVHGASFDTATGACCGGPARSGLVAVPVKVIDGAVWLADAPAPQA
jgi:nitrite reductase/ring-hydroxylating ferredoxin subunit